MIAPKDRLFVKLLQMNDTALQGSVTCKPLSYFYVTQAEGVIKEKSPEEYQLLSSFNCSADITTPLLLFRYKKGTCSLEIQTASKKEAGTRCIISHPCLCIIHVWQPTTTLPQQLGEQPSLPIHPASGPCRLRQANLKDRASHSAHRNYNARH